MEFFQKKTKIGIFLKKPELGYWLLFIHMWGQIKRLRKVGGRKKFCMLKGAHFPEDDATTFGSISPSPPPTSSTSDEHPLLLAAEFQQKLGIISPPQLTNSSLFRFDRAPYIPSSQFLFFFFFVLRSGFDSDVFSARRCSCSAGRPCRSSGASPSSPPSDLAS